MSRVFAAKIAKLCLLLAFLLVSAPGGSLWASTGSQMIDHQHGGTFATTEFCSICNCCDDEMCSGWHGTACDADRCQHHPENVCTNA